MTSDRRVALVHGTVATLLVGAVACSGNSLVGPSFERFIVKATPSPSDYPDVPGVVLLDRGTLFLTANTDKKKPVARLRRYRRLKVLRESGLKLARVEIPFEPGTVVSDVIAHAVQPDGDTSSIGTIVKIKHDSGVPAFAFIVPDVVPGTVIEYAYDHYFDDLRFLPPWLFASDLPTLRSEYATIVPRGFDITYRYLEGGDSAERPPERFDVDEGTRLFWARTNVPATFPERGMPYVELLAPQIRINFVRAVVGGQPFDGFGSWEDVREWFFDIAGDWTRLTEEQQAEARRIAGETSEEEKALKLLTIIARDLKWEAGKPLPVFLTFIPSANTTLQNKTGNVTSRGLVLTSLLRAAGLDAHIGLVTYRDKGRLFPDIPDARRIDAVVSVIPRRQGPLVLDPSQMTVDADVPSPRLQGARIAMLREDIVEMIDVPISAPADSRTDVTYSLSVDADGNASGTMQATLTGAEAGQLRDALLNAEPSAYPDIISQFLGERGAALALDSASIADLQALRRPLTLKGGVTPVRIMEGDGDVVTLTLARLVGTNTPKLREVRRHRLELGAPRHSEVKATIVFPDDHEPQEPPPAFRSDWTSGETSIEVRAETSRRIRVKRVDRHAVLAIEPTGYGAFARHDRTVRDAEEAQVLVNRPPPRRLEY